MIGHVHRAAPRIGSVVNSKLRRGVYDSTQRPGRGYDQPPAFRTPSAAKERQQGDVQAVLVDMQQSMRAAFVDNELCTRNELSGQFRGDIQRDV